MESKVSGWCSQQLLILCIMRRMNPVQVPRPILLRSILILFSHMKLSPTTGLFTSGFPTKILNAFLFFPYVPHALPISQIHERWRNAFLFFPYVPHALPISQKHERWIKLESRNKIFLSQNSFQLLKDAVSSLQFIYSYEWTDGTNKTERIWKDAVMAWFKTLQPHVPERIEEMSG